MDPRCRGHIKITSRGSTQINRWKGGKGEAERERQAGTACRVKPHASAFASAPAPRSCHRRGGGCIARTTHRNLQCSSTPSPCLQGGMTGQGQGCGGEGKGEKVENRLGGITVNPACSQTAETTRNPCPQQPARSPRSEARALSVSSLAPRPTRQTPQSRNACGNAPPQHCA